MLTKKQTKKLLGITENQYYGRKPIDHDVFFNDALSVPEGFNPVVLGSLHMNSLVEVPEGFNPVVYGVLNLDDVKKVHKSFNPIAKYISMDSIKTLPEGITLTAGTTISLQRLATLPNNFKIVAQNSIHLSNLSRQVVADHARDIHSAIVYTKEGALCLHSIINIDDEGSWADKSYKVVDNYFCKVTKEKDNVLEGITKFGHKIFIKDKGRYAYVPYRQILPLYQKCVIDNQDTTPYNNWTLDTPITLEEAIRSYRAITGVCLYGTVDFIKELSYIPKKLTPRKVIRITSIEKGNDKYELFMMTRNKNNK